MALAWTVCVVCLFRSQKTLSPRQRWSLTGIFSLLFLVLVMCPLSFELEMLNQIEEFLFSVLFYIALPFFLLIRAFRFKRLWLKTITILIIALLLPVSLFCFVIFIGTQPDRKLITQFDSQDGSVYIIREHIQYGFHSDRCLTMTQHQRVIPGLLALKKKFDEDIDNRGWFGCAGSADRSIESVKTYFQSK